MEMADLTYLQQGYIGEKTYIWLGGVKLVGRVEASKPTVGGDLIGRVAFPDGRTNTARDIY